MTSINLMKVGLKAIAVLAALSSASASAGPEDAYNRTTDAKKIGWMDRGKEAVKSQLKDPGSAQFRGVYFHRGSDGIPMTCGEVNSKNSYGGYIGYQKFISAGKPELTFLQEQVADFATIWNRMCR